MDEETLRKLEALPDRKMGVPARVWTQTEDAALLKHWLRAKQEDVSKLLGVAETTARDRYRYLKGRNDNV
jgi:hypothetical protein